MKGHLKVVQGLSQKTQPRADIQASLKADVWLTVYHQREGSRTSSAPVLTRLRMGEWGPWSKTPDWLQKLMPQRMRRFQLELWSKQWCTILGKRSTTSPKKAVFSTTWEKAGERTLMSGQGRCPSTALLASPTHPPENRGKPTNQRRGMVPEAHRLLTTCTVHAKGFMSTRSLNHQNHL